MAPRPRARASVSDSAMPSTTVSTHEFATSLSGCPARPGRPTRCASRSRRAPGPRRPRLVGPGGQDHQRPVLGRLLGAEHRRVDVHQTELLGPRGQPVGALDADGRLLQQHGARLQPGAGLVERRLHGVDVEQHGQHDVGVAHRVGGGAGHLGAGLGERLCLGAGPVPDPERDPGGGDVARHAGTHRAGAQEGHGRLVGHASTSCLVVVSKRQSSGTRRLVRPLLSAANPTVIPGTGGGAPSRSPCSWGSCRCST